MSYSLWNIYWLEIHITTGTMTSSHSLKMWIPHFLFIKSTTIKQKNECMLYQTTIWSVECITDTKLKIKYYSFSIEIFSRIYFNIYENIANSIIYGEIDCPSFSFIYCPGNKMPALLFCYHFINHRCWQR